MEEAHLDEAHILAALERFASERADRMRRLRDLLEDTELVSVLNGMLAVSDRVQLPVLDTPQEFEPLDRSDADHHS